MLHNAQQQQLCTMKHRLILKEVGMSMTGAADDTVYSGPHFVVGIRNKVKRNINVSTSVGLNFIVDPFRDERIRASSR